jgi:hypothetical protein
MRHLFRIDFLATEIFHVSTSLFPMHAAALLHHRKQLSSRRGFIMGDPQAGHLTRTSLFQISTGAEHFGQGKSAISLNVHLLMSIPAHFFICFP